MYFASEFFHRNQRNWTTRRFLILCRDSTISNQRPVYKIRRCGSMWSTDYRIANDDNAFPWTAPFSPGAPKQYRPSNLSKGYVSSVAFSSLDCAYFKATRTEEIQMIPILECKALYTCHEQRWWRALRIIRWQSSSPILAAVYLIHKIAWRALSFVKPVFFIVFQWIPRHRSPLQAKEL